MNYKMSCAVSVSGLNLKTPLTSAFELRYILSLPFYAFSLPFFLMLSVPVIRTNESAIFIQHFHILRSLEFSKDFIPPKKFCHSLL